ncbi:MAG: hypothetical protein LBJ00_16520 [Planctomycetaceae bacterium]|nr:hypothetical protein [Planctomycetaceae bacterium]
MKRLFRGEAYRLTGYGIKEENLILICFLENVTLASCCLFAIVVNDCKYTQTGVDAICAISVSI